jgi:selenocysteine-specific translation elongation factor
MKHLAVGVFQDDAIARELGKKDTESDIAMFHRKMEEEIFTFIYPVEDKLSAKSQIVSCIDAAIVAFAERSRELGETIVMLDALGISTGIAVTSPYATPDQIAAITKDTALESFIVGKREPAKMLEVLKSYHPERDAAAPALVQVDHSFSVKGVGEVILGFVKTGIVRKYDKLTLWPSKKEVTVRSIQIQDEDQDEAEAGSRVGLAIKGATVDEMKRGSILSSSDSINTDTSLTLSFKKSPFYSDEVRQGAFHITVGMQTLPITVAQPSDTTSIHIESEKPIVYTLNDTFLLLDLNAKRTRIVGSGNAQPQP